MGDVKPTRSGQRVWLLYARSEPEGPEPLIAVCDSEETAVGIERDVAALHPGTRVMWEVHEAESPLGETVHIVSLNPSALANPMDDPDAIGIGVYATAEEAEDEARQRRSSGDPNYVVMTLPRGWRRHGWPFGSGARARGAGD